MRFHEALSVLIDRKGTFVYNEAGEDKTLRVGVKRTEELPFLYMISSRGTGPWVPNQLDMFSETWRIYR